MQATSGIRPNFCCTVCHQQFDLLYDFKGHLESQEHELAYGIRLRNSMVRSCFYLTFRILGKNIEHEKYVITGKYSFAGHMAFLFIERYWVGLADIILTSKD